MPLMLLTALIDKSPMHRIYECVPFLFIAKNTSGKIEFKLDYNQILQAVIIGLLVGYLGGYFDKGRKEEIVQLRQEVSIMKQDIEEIKGITRQLYVDIYAPDPRAPMRDKR